MKRLLPILLVMLLTACSDNSGSSTDRLARQILEEYPNLNSSAIEYDAAENMAQNAARSWNGTVPDCLNDEYYTFHQCITLYGQTYAVFSSPVGCAGNSNGSLSLLVYILAPVDYQTAMTLVNENPGNLLVHGQSVPQYKISGTMVNYDPSDLAGIAEDNDEINLGCLILGPSTITKTN